MTVTVSRVVEAWTRAGVGGGQTHPGPRHSIGRLSFPFSVPPRTLRRSGDPRNGPKVERSICTGGESKKDGVCSGTLTGLMSFRQGREEITSPCSYRTQGDTRKEKSRSRRTFEGPEKRVEPVLSRSGPTSLAVGGEDPLDTSTQFFPWGSDLRDQVHVSSIPKVSGPGL